MLTIGWIYVDFMPNPISNGTLCMDSRYETTKHYNIHGVYSHYMIESTAKYNLKIYQK